MTENARRSCRVFVIVERLLKRVYGRESSSKHKQRELHGLYHAPVFLGPIASAEGFVSIVLAQNT